MKINPLLSLLMLSGCAMAGRAWADPVLLNGGFEAPTVTQATEGGGTSWSAGTTAGVGQVPYEIVPNSAGDGVTPYGSQFLLLEPQAYDSQSTAGFQVGTIYVVGFDFAVGETGGLNPTVQATFSGVYNFTESFTAPTTAYAGNSTIPFTSEAIVFYASASGSETIKFTDVGGSALVIDNVGLYGNANAIPEPSSWAAILTGSGIAWAGLRRRRLS